MDRQEYKKELETKGRYYDVAMMEFTDLLREYDIKVVAPVYDVLGQVLLRFKNRLDGV